MSDSFVRNGAEVDGLVNYESVLRSLNASGRLAEPLTLVYPADGVATADYPLTLLGSASREAREKYDELAELTGGRAFDAREQSLQTVFREIRGYQ